MNIRKLLTVFLLLLAAMKPVQRAEAAEITLLAFGDSLTQGFGLRPSDGFVPQLERWLRDRSGQDVTVINGGVSGDTSAGGAARIGWSLTDNVDAVIVNFGGNDVLRGLPPEDTRVNLEAIIRAVGEKGKPVLLVGMPVPDNYGSDYKTKMSAIWPDLARQYQTVYYPNFFAALGRDPEVFLSFMQADGVHPNARGVRRIVGQIGPEVMELIYRVEK